MSYFVKNALELGFGSFFIDKQTIRGVSFQCLIPGARAASGDCHRKSCKVKVQDAYGFTIV